MKPKGLRWRDLENRVCPNCGRLNMDFIDINVIYFVELKK